MRFHLIDRIETYETWRSIRARKLTAHNETYWDVSKPVPTMPQALVLEALCQAGSWLMLLSSQLSKRAALLSIGSVTYLQGVKVGDVLHMEGNIDSVSEEVAVFSGTVFVAGVPVLEAQEIMCVLLAAETLEDPADTARMQRTLTREEKM